MVIDYSLLYLINVYVIEETTVKSETDIYDTSKDIGPIDLNLGRLIQGDTNTINSQFVV